MNKETAFKFLITEFHELKFPVIKNRLYELPETEKIITIVGVRRSGKTFFLYQTIQNLLVKGVPKKCIIYINFEDDRLFSLNIEDMNDLIEAYYSLYPDTKELKKYFFFDEIQVIKNWELFIRRLADKENIRLFLTGSSSKLTSQEIATSLRGRTLSIQFYPLNFLEYLNFFNVKVPKNFRFSEIRHKIRNLFEKYVFEGGFPEVITTSNLKSEVLRSYYDLIFYRDLVERYNLRNFIALRHLMRYLLTNVANPFSFNSYFRILNQQIKISKDTLLEYFGYLQEIQFIFSVKLFSYSVKQQQVNPVKIYCIDNGLRNNVAFQFSKDEGRLVENIVFLTLKRKYSEIYYWKGKNEVDFVIHILQKKEMLLINVCYDDEIPLREYKGLNEFKKAFPEINCKLLILTKNINESNTDIIKKPVWEWILSEILSSNS